MFVGDMTSFVRISNYMVGTGIGNPGKQIYTYSMELEGKLLKFYYGRFRDQDRDELQKTTVYVQIEFTESSITIDDEENYIGKISLFEKQEKDVFEQNNLLRITINLPVNIFSQLCLLEGKNFIFETVQDIINNPTDDQKTDRIIAFVKRIYIQVTPAEIKKESDKKKFTISLR